MIRHTSVSDDATYPEFCYHASKHDDVFEHFRRSPKYNYIVEHFSDREIQIGGEYLSSILRNTSLHLDLNKWNELLKNDSVGHPRIADYELNNGGGITASPTTIRYIKVISDIISLFDTEKIKTVAEVGVGYAGQCRIFANILPITTYYLIDLPEVLSLSERFLNEVGISRSVDVRYIDGTHLYNAIHSDFFISNYAFSELTKPVQDTYLEKIILNSKAGYITWNYGGERLNIWNNHGYRLEEILSIIPNSVEIPEDPPRTEYNRIVLWGNKNL